jgi:hypothetical protein
MSFLFKNEVFDFLSQKIHNKSLETPTVFLYIVDLGRNGFVIEGRILVCSKISWQD